MSNLTQLKNINGNINVNQTFELALTSPNKIPLAKANLAHVITNGTKAMEKCDPVSLANAVVQMTNLNFSAQTNKAYVIPYGTKATFQIGVHGWVNLAIRSKRIARLNTDIVYEGVYQGKDFITGDYKFDISKRKSDKIIGYMSYLELTDGFKKTLYLTAEEMHNHFVTHSSNNYDEKKRLWMESKKKGIVSKKLTVEEKGQITMIKRILQKYAPLDPSLETALANDGKTYDKTGVGSFETKAEVKTISKKRVPVEKELIMEFFKVIKVAIADQEFGKNQEDANNWLREKVSESGINFNVSNGWYGITADELKGLCDLIEKELGKEIVISGRRLSQEKPELEKETQVDLDS